MKAIKNQHPDERRTPPLDCGETPFFLALPRPERAERTLPISSEKTRISFPLVRLKPDPKHLPKSLPFCPPISPRIPAIHPSISRPKHPETTLQPPKILSRTQHLHLPKFPTLLTTKPAQTPPSNPPEHHLLRPPELPPSSHHNQYPPPQTLAIHSAQKSTQQLSSSPAPSRPS